MTAVRHLPRRRAANAMLMISSVLAAITPALAQTADALLPKAPIARQILPLVEPVKRKAPAAVSNLAPGLKSAGAAATPRVTAAVKPVARTKIVTVAPPATQPAAPAVAQPATIAAPRQFVAYTCKLGQDYSVERRECFTPGVTTAAGVGKKASQKAGRTTLARAAAEPGKRSSLGANLGARRNLR